MAFAEGQFVLGETLVFTNRKVVQNQETRGFRTSFRACSQVHSSYGSKVYGKLSAQQAEFGSEAFQLRPHFRAKIEGTIEMELQVAASSLVRSHLG